MEKESLSQCTQCGWVGKDEELEEVTKMSEDKCAVPDYVCPKCSCDEITYTFVSEWTCPDCHFDPPEFDGNFYKFNETEKKIETKHFEDGVKVPDNYYPKFGPREYRRMDSGFDFEEIHYCPNCKKEFSFYNGT